MNYHVHFLQEQNELDDVMDGLKGAEWIGFDTEFVGEKTFVPVLCLLQVVARQDIYLIDTLKIKDLSRFLQIVSDPNTLKITHAGDNDYRLLNTLYGTVPLNTFDTQIAAGFTGYNYPAGFGKIVERELGVTLSKSHTVADWEARPIDPKAIDYAIEDVKYLPALHDKLMKKLQRRQRAEWAREENLKWETPACYAVDPYKEAFANDYIHQLDFKEKTMLLRLYAWRREKAIALNLPKEQVLQNRHVSSVLRAVKDGAGAARVNRTLPEHIWRKYYPEWQGLWKARATDVESDLLRDMPVPAPENPEQEWSMELLYHFVKKRCLEHEISAALLLPRGDFNKIKSGEPFDPALLSGWRAALLGAELTAWLQRRGRLELNWQDDACLLKMKE